MSSKKRLSGKRNTKKAKITVCGNIYDVYLINKMADWQSRNGCFKSEMQFESFTDAHVMMNDLYKFLKMVDSGTEFRSPKLILFRDSTIALSEL